MASNPYVNKVQTADGTILIDLSQDTVTSASDIVSGKVGHLADGSQVTGTASGGGGALIVGVQDDGVSKLTLNKTWQEIYDAMASGQGAVLVDEIVEEGQIVYQIAQSVITIDGGSGDYNLVTEGAGGTPELWYTSSTNGYPTSNY